MKNQKVLVGFLVLVIIVVIAGLGVPGNSSMTPTKANYLPIIEAEFKVVPLAVNVLKDVTISDEEIDNIVKEANDNLKQANLHLEFDKTRNIKRNFNDQGNNNDKIEEGEDQKLNDSCVDELDSAYGVGKGYKVVFANQIHGDDDTYGWAIMCDPHIPVMYLKVREGTAKSKGNDLAHETAHLSSLGAGHKIDDTTNADSKGHHPTDMTNKMYPYNPTPTGVDRGDKFTQDQREEINKGAKKRGKSKLRTADGVFPTDHCYSWFSDPLDDAPIAHIDIISGFVGSNYENPNIVNANIGVRGLHPSSPVFCTHELFFDTDNNDGTGGTYPPFQGIEKILRIDLSGQWPFTGPGEFLVEIYCVQSGITTPLPPGEVCRYNMVSDMMWPSTPQTNGYHDSICQSFPLDLLGPGLLADQLPVGVQLTDIYTGISDDSEFLFQLSCDKETGPMIDINRIQASPGDEIILQGKNFCPGTIFININGSYDYPPLLETDGTFTISVPVPSIEAGDYFIIATDECGLFDFSVINITPSPGEVVVGGTVVEEDIFDIIIYWSVPAMLIMAVGIWLGIFKRRAKTEGN